MKIKSILRSLPIPIIMLGLCIILLILVIFLNKYNNEHFSNELNNKIKDKYITYTDFYTQEKLRDLMGVVHNFLEKRKIEYWICGGTLLGAERHQDIIPFDDDLDIGMRDSEFNKLLNLQSELDMMGYVLLETKYCYKIFPKNGEEVKGFTHLYPFIDIFTVKEENGIFMYSNPNALKIWYNDKLSKDELFPLKKLKFNKYELYAPFNHKSYLNNAYGKDHMEICYKQYDHKTETGLNRKKFKPYPEIKFDKPFLWLYWDDLSPTRPSYIDLCIESIYKNCHSFNIQMLNKDNLHKYLPELFEPENEMFKNKLDNLIMAHKVDYYRILLMYKYGGLYLDADTLCLKDPIDIYSKLKEVDFIGFGCTGQVCTNGYNYPSNGIMASRPNTELMRDILAQLEHKIMTIDKFEYFDLGKYVIWKSLKKLGEGGWKYHHMSNHFDGTRDNEGYWVNMKRLFSNEDIQFKHLDKMYFIILYNSNGTDEDKSLTKEELLNKNYFISKQFKRALKLN